MQRQLSDAAVRGIDVRLLVPGKSDVPMAQWVARAAYARLLTCGARIYEYRPRVLHAKTMLVDDQWAAIGTANMDYRSLFAKDEINFVDCGAKSIGRWTNCSRSILPSRKKSATRRGDCADGRPWSPKVSAG